MPVPFVSSLSTRLLGCERSRVRLDLPPAVTGTPVICPRTKVPSPRGRVTETSTDPAAEPLSTSEYGEAVGLVINPSIGEAWLLPKGTMTADTTSARGGCALKSVTLPLLSERTTSTGAALLPFVTAKEMKSGPEAANCAI